MPAKPMYRSFPQNNRLLWAFLLVLGLAVGVQAQSLVNTAHVVDSAGGASQSFSYSNTSAVGQPFGFNENNSASYVNQGGFLNGGSQKADYLDVVWEYDTGIWVSGEPITTSGRGYLNWTK